jgi:hypothetical protein
VVLSLCLSLEGGGFGLRTGLDCNFDVEKGKCAVSRELILAAEILSPLTSEDVKGQGGAGRSPGYLVRGSRVDGERAVCVCVWEGGRSGRKMVNADADEQRVLVRLAQNRTEQNTQQQQHHHHPSPAPPLPPPRK